MSDRACGKDFACEAQCVFEGVGLPQSAKFITCKKHHSVFLQGNVPQGIYCIVNGNIKMVISQQDGKESIIRLLKSGNIFGLSAILSNQNYNASAIAMEDTTLHFFAKEEVLELIKIHPLVALKLMAILAEQMRVSENKNLSLVHKNVRERAAGLLISLAKNYGVKEALGIRLEIKLTREEMAAMIGTTIETIVRLMTEFKHEGILQQEGKVIYIINEKKLIEFANE